MCKKFEASFHPLQRSICKIYGVTNAKGTFPSSPFVVHHEFLEEAAFFVWGMYRCSPFFSFSRALSHRPTASKLVPSSPPTSRKKKLRRETCTPQDFFSPTHHNLPFSLRTQDGTAAFPHSHSSPKEGKKKEERKASPQQTKNFVVAPLKVCPLHVQRNKDGRETSSFLPSWVLNAGDHHLLRKVCAFAALV